MTNLTPLCAKRGGGVEEALAEMLHASTSLQHLLRHIFKVDWKFHLYSTYARKTLHKSSDFGVKNKDKKQ